MTDASGEPALDVATGACSVGGCTFEPSRPQSAYLGALRALGAELPDWRYPTTRYEFRVHAWRVSVTFGMGVLTGLTLELDAGNGEERDAAHAAWLGRQVGDRSAREVDGPWGVASVSCDKHFSSAQVDISWRRVPIVGDAPRRDDLQAIRKATLFASGPMGDDWELPDAYVAYERLLTAPPPADVLEHIMAVEATAAARRYAGALLERAG